MPFHPCFISFRHFDSELSERFVRQFEQCLSAELEPLTGKKPFIDFLRMQPGYSLNASVAAAVCQSTCMIVIWSPQYFSEDHLWCTREFTAMLALENARLQLLPPNERNKKLIIPVIFRGSKHYPFNLSDTLYLNFEKFSHSKKQMSRNERFSEEIRKLAEYIHERIIAFENSNVAPWGDCDKFALPDVDEARTYIKNNLRSNSFPLR